jgi:hypothetical protein
MNQLKLSDSFFCQIELKKNFLGIIKPWLSIFKQDFQVVLEIVIIS